MSVPFDINIGDIILHGGRKIRFEADLGDGDLHITDVRTGARVRVTDPETGKLVTTTVEWLRRELLAGNIHVLRNSRRTAQGPRGDFTDADEEAADASDPRASWKRTWVREARRLNIKSEPACKRFIKKFGEHITAAYFERKGRKYTLPGASTLKRWILEFPEHFSPGAYVSHAGRPKGCSQLTDAEDMLIHEGAVYYWAQNGASIVSAHTWVAEAWKNLPPERRTAGKDKAPSYEAVRLRIWSLSTYDTVKAKFGKERADRLFDAVGEPFEVNRAFERVFADGTEFEQACVFGEDWQLPGGKMRGVFAMDAFSTYIFDPTVFGGPYREEMSIEALCRVMTPPDYLTEEELAFDEFIGWTFGIPEYVTPDNDRTLIGPGYIPALNDLGCRLELPKTYHHDAKAPLEWFFSWIKAQMRTLPGTILSARHKKDVRTDPVKGAELTVAQYRTIVRSLVWEHNHTATTRLNDRSPYQVLKASALAHGAATLENPHRIRTMLGKTIPDRVMTNDGVEYDGIQYRGPEVGGFLRRNSHATPKTDQIDATKKCIVSIRTNEANIDYIMVWDDEAKAFIVLWSTQESYTSYLSRWEHDKYRQMAKARKEKFDTEGQRIRSRIKSLETIDKQAPAAAFRRRSVMFALAQSEEVRALSGARAKKKDFLELPEHFVIVQSSVGMRGDPGTPPPGAKTESVKKPPAAPARPAGRGISPGRDAGDLTTEEKPRKTDWDAVGTVIPDDWDCRMDDDDVGGDEHDDHDDQEKGSEDDED